MIEPGAHRAAGTPDNPRVFLQHYQVVQGDSLSFITGDAEAEQVSIEGDGALEVCNPQPDPADVSIGGKQAHDWISDGFGSGSATLLGRRVSR